MFKLLALVALAAVCLTAQPPKTETLPAPLSSTPAQTSAPLLPAASLSEYYRALYILSQMNVQLLSSMTAEQKRVMEAIEKQRTEAQAKETELRRICTEAKGTFSGAAEGNVTCAAAPPSTPNAALSPEKW